MQNNLSSESPLIVDLHSHTKRSDGTLTPVELVERAKEMGVDMLALTDHDTICGLAEARSKGNALGVKIISGIEFSSVWNGMGIHIVGLGFDETHPAMLQAVEIQGVKRKSRAHTIAERMEKRGFPGLLEQAEQIADGGQVGRPHFARAMVENGQVKNIAQAFKKHLGSGKPGDVKAEWPEMHTVVDWITSAGGTAVLAHPDKYNLTRTKMKLLLEAFVEAGGQAIEVVTSGIDDSYKRKLADMCIEYDLMASQGSDFHSPAPWAELGRLAPMPKELKTVWQQWI